jgi:transcriptional regulator with XRE-family HTH domain
MKNFSQHLKDGIQAKFGRPLRVSEFARASQLRLKHEVSYEAVRKWMTGKSIPKLEILTELIAWLNLEPNQLFDYSDKDQILHPKLDMSRTRKPEKLDDDLVEHLLERAHLG